jgi:tetratricopeptide (TPR) repeat protein
MPRNRRGVARHGLAAARARVTTLAYAALACAALLGSAAQASAQDTPGLDDTAPLQRAMQLEQEMKYREAAAAYRAALTTTTASSAMLGFERVCAELGWGDTVLVVVDSAIRALPRNPVLRTVQLRTLRTGGREAEARAAFERWTGEMPRDPTPYREYSRLLLQEGRSAAADTVLQQAQRALGSTRDFTTELAQLRAALGMWEPAARSWREALDGSPYLVQAATYSLRAAPAAARDTIRRVLAAPPAAFAARRALAGLELGWGAPRAAWEAIKNGTPNDSTAAAWREFGEQAEAAEAWLAARDAFAAVNGWKRDPELAARAGADALSGGDAASALALTTSAAGGLDSARVARQLLPVQVRALTALGRAEEAERMIAAYAGALDADGRAQLTRAVAQGWVRAGDIGRARAALAAAGGEDDGDTSGWLALYEGDFKTARATLRHSNDASPELVTALALLARTRAERAPLTGAAFLAMARGDTARAARDFTDAAAELPEAAPLLLVTAARLHSARHDDAAAVGLWERIVAQYAAAPEAAEADLEWGRTLRRQGSSVEAVKRLEHLILTYPNSALVPQARRELELARSTVPSAS